MGDCVSEYQEFLESKAQNGEFCGFSPAFIPSRAFPFQERALDWACRKGRSLAALDCGMGKSLIELAFAENIARETNGAVMLFAPMAVGYQMMIEAEKFGVEAHRTDGKVWPGINITNYEKMHRFNPNDFVGTVGDEASCIKAFNGKRRRELTEFMRRHSYRLLATATPAPNDQIELGAMSEALGELGQVDMLARYFKNDQNTSDQQGKWKGYAAPRQHVMPKWRFKGHAEKPFLRWLCSWMLAARKPSDLGFSDDGFILPHLIETEHIVKSRTLAPGMLFEAPASNMPEEREERRRTIPERCEKAAELVYGTGEQSVIWCDLDDEGDLLTEIIPGSKQICGKHSEEYREEVYRAFTAGELKDLIIKRKIGAWGMNWQHCGHVVSFATHSYEQYFQSIRRCWRYGRVGPVRSDLIATEGEIGTMENMKRKSHNADLLFSSMIAEANKAIRVDTSYKGNSPAESPAWLF